MGAIVWFGLKRNYSTPSAKAPTLEVTVIPKQVNSPSPSPSPSLIIAPTPTVEISKALSSPSPTNTPTESRQTTQPSVVDDLIVPVSGVRPEQLTDTFDDARSEGRVHDAIDIPAPQGTPVLAATNGTVAKLFHSDKGGTTIYQLSTDQKVIYDYAHLQRYADGLVGRQIVRQGDVIAYVGDTGWVAISTFTSPYHWLPIQNDTGKVQT